MSALPNAVAQAAAATAYVPGSELQLLSEHSWAIRWVSSPVPGVVGVAALYGPVSVYATG